MMGRINEVNFEKKSIFQRVEKCPACDSAEIDGNFLSGEIFCRKCGLVL